MCGWCSPGLFVKFTEINDHEGETWVFFLELSGNQVYLGALATLIDDVQNENGGNIEFELDLVNLVEEDAVDVLVKYSPEGYMPTFNKVVGRMKLPSRSELVEEYEHGPEFNGLYKGGIVKLFSKDQ